VSADQDIKNAIKQLEKLGKKLQDEVVEIAKEAAHLIKKRTRLGYGVEHHGAKKNRLDKLSDGYKATRKRHKPKGPSTASKSNLTYTGKMLDDLVAEPNGQGKAKIRLRTDLSRDKAKWVSGKRPFLNLSKSEMKQLQQLLNKKLTKLTDK